MIKFSTIKQAFKSLVDKDSSRFPKGQAEYNQKPTEYARLAMYGLCTNAPKDSHVLLISSQNQESVKFGIENDFIRRFKNLKEGEVVLFNTLTNAFVFLKEDGTIEVNSDSEIKSVVGSSEIVLTSSSLSIDVGSGTVDFTASSITHNGKEIGENHGHTQANDGAGDTEQPISGVT